MLISELGTKPLYSYIGVHAVYYYTRALFPSTKSQIYDR